MPESQSMVDRLLALDTCCVSDALDKLGMKGAVIGLRSLSVSRKVAGSVVTVKLGPPQTNGPKIHLGAGAIMAAEEGQIIAVEHGRDDVSGWGGLLSRAASRKNLPAIIVDGAVRDIDESREFDLPVFARAAVPVTARGRISEHAFNVPITISDVDVNPGDFVVADGSGIVFISQDRAKEIVATAEDIYAREQLMAAAIDRGESISDVMGADYEDMLMK